MKITKKELTEAFEKSLNLDAGQPLASQNAKEILLSIDNVLSGTSEIKNSDNHDILKQIKIKASKYKSRPGTQRVYSRTASFKKGLLSIAAAAVIAVMIIPGILKENLSSPHQILSWRGNPYIQENSKRINLEKSRLIHGNIRIATGKFDTLKLKTIGATIILSKNAAMTINGIKNKTSVTRLIAGMARFTANKNKVSSFNLAFPGGSLKSTSSDFAMQISGKKTKILVMEGSVSVTKGTQNSRITGGSGLHIDNSKMKLVKTPEKNRHFKELRTFISGKRKPDLHTTIKKQKLEKKKQAGFRERIHLKNGTVLTGRILFQDKKIIRMKTSLGIMNIPWHRINKVSYVKGIER